MALHTRVHRASLAQHSMRSAHCFATARPHLYAARLTERPYPGWQVPVFTESLDVRDAAAIEALPARLPQEFAEVDILVNNAGLALGTAPVTEISTEVRLL